MHAARPTAWSSFALGKLIHHASNALVSCFDSLCKFNPTDPFIASEWRNIFPSIKYFWMAEQNLFEIIGNLMHNPR